MPDKYEAGNGEKLSIVRWGRDEFAQHERQATEQILPGQAVTPTTDGDGNRAYALHDGTADDPHYVALEARQRGMDAQTTDGYPVDDMVIAVDGAGAGLNLRVQAGETLTEGDALVIASDGNYAAYVSADDSVTDIVGHAAEDADLSGNSDPELVAVNLED